MDATPKKRAGAIRCGGALEVGDCAARDPLAQLGDALGGVGAAAIVAEAAEPVPPQAASKGEGRGWVPAGPDKRAGATVRRRTRAR